MYDDLWQTRNGSAAWFDNCPPDQREWLEGLAEKIVEKGSEPVWSQTGALFRRTFGVDKPVNSTIAETVRRLVKNRV